MEPNLEWLRSLMTIVSLSVFIGIVLWAWSARKQIDFDSAARSVLTEDDLDPNHNHRRLS